MACVGPEAQPGVQSSAVGTPDLHTCCALSPPPEEAEGQLASMIGIWSSPVPLPGVQLPHLSCLPSDEPQLPRSQWDPWLAYWPEGRG